MIRPLFQSQCKSRHGERAFSVAAPRTDPLGEGPSLQRQDLSEL